MHLEHGAVHICEGTVGAFVLGKETMGDFDVGVEYNFESAGEGAPRALCLWLALVHELKVVGGYVGVEVAQEVISDVEIAAGAGNGPLVMTCIANLDQGFLLRTIFIVIRGIFFLECFLDVLVIP